MELDNRLKKEVSEGVVKALLEDAGYRVIQFGIESQARELSCMDKDEYKALELSRVIRTTPDFLVLDREQSKVELVEVKFRQTWDETLIDSVRQQTERYGTVLLILFLDQCNSRKAFGENGKEIKDPDSVTLKDRLRSPAGYVRCMRFNAEETPDGFEVTIVDNKPRDELSMRQKTCPANLPESWWWKMWPLHKELSGLSEGSISQSILRMRGLFTSLNESDEHSTL